MIRKFLFVTVTLALTLSSLSCGPGAKEETPAPSEPSSTTQEVKPIEPTNEDIEWLATVIASEAGSVHDKGSWVRCTDEERAAVGWTVINRLNADAYGESIKDIVTAQAQYAHNQEPNAEIKELARKLLAGTIEDTTGGATHFFSPISMPKEGEPTAGFDIGGGLHNVSGIDSGVYFPSWAETMTYVADLQHVRQAYFMFYRSTVTAQKPAPSQEQPAPTPPSTTRTGKIAFVQDGDIYLMDPDGSNKVKLVSAPEGYWLRHPVWSPDGKRIAFGMSTGESSYRRDIFTVNTDGTNLMRVFGHPRIGVTAWLPDGKKMVFEETDNECIYIIDLTGLQRTMLALGTAPSVSPDGEKVAFRKNDGNIYTVNIDGTSEVRVVPETSSRPVWSPDSKKLAYAAGAHGLDVFIADADGTGKTLLVYGGGWLYSWSPDGGRVGFSKMGYIHIINTDGTGEIRLDTPQYVMDLLDWSPDGQRILINSEGDLYALDADGGEPTRLTEFGNVGEAAWGLISGRTPERPATFEKPAIVPPPLTPGMREVSAQDLMAGDIEVHSGDALRVTGKVSSSEFWGDPVRSWVWFEHEGPYWPEKADWLLFEFRGAAAKLVANLYLCPGQKLVVQGVYDHGSQWQGKGRVLTLVDSSVVSVSNHE